MKVVCGLCVCVIVVVTVAVMLRESCRDGRVALYLLIFKKFNSLTHTKHHEILHIH